MVRKKVMLCYIFLYIHIIPSTQYSIRSVWSIATLNLVSSFPSSTPLSYPFHSHLTYLLSVSLWSKFRSPVVHLLFYSLQRIVKHNHFLYPIIFCKHRCNILVSTLVTVYHLSFFSPLTIATLSFFIAHFNMLYYVFFIFLYLLHYLAGR
jgi:hypothetical protein